MQTDKHNSVPLVWGYRLRRFSYPLLFLLLLTLASASGAWVGGVALGDTTPPGTIPPGGTLPPPPTPAAGTGLVRVLHLAPFDPVIANTAVDICTTVGSPVAGLTDLVYLEQSGYIAFPAGTYDWLVGTPGCATAILDLPAFTLQSGNVLTLLIVGGDNQPLSTVLLVEAEAKTQFYLPLIYR